MGWNGRCMGKGNIWHCLPARAGLGRCGREYGRTKCLLLESKLPDHLKGKVQVVRIVLQALKTEIEMQVPGAGLFVQSIHDQSINADLTGRILDLSHRSQQAQFAEAHTLCALVHGKAAQ